MKKIILFSAVALLCASMVFAAGFTKKDLAALKGTWAGTASGGAGISVDAKLEIMNDAEPLQAKLILSKIPEKAKSEFNVQDPIMGESNNGKITSAGTIMFLGASPTNFFEITSIKEKKLSGWGFFNGFKANVTLTKK
ncbi:MAG TPA: hypothetical protein VLK23_13295 [Thermodesulfobacteriota bacterium]|nr:hypothetical protein [Thermodesulfobacteriota bacterium]